MQRVRSPQEAYARIDLDARVAGAATAQLVDICYEQVVTALGTAIFAEEHGNNLLKSQSLTRALSAVTALQMGVDRRVPIAAALLQFFGSARQSILDGALDFDAAVMAAIRADFQDVQVKLRGR